MNTLYRQGDVFLLAGVTLPATAVKQRDCILALGEVTGHCHQVREGAALYADLDGERYLVVEAERAVVVHEEHGPIELGRGVYRVGIQVEYTPEGLRDVTD